MGFNCGIVGLPNVGKSTLFNALTQAGAAAENFPFCTIDPNKGIVPLADPRLDRLAQISQPEKITPTVLEVVDIAGLVKGASQGEGLGNRFLGHIQAVDAILHVVRCFEDENVTHVAGTVDPRTDFEVIETELGLHDLEVAEKRFERVSKQATFEKALKTESMWLERLVQHLGDGHPARTMALENADERQWTRQLGLLTAKPVLLVANVDEDGLTDSPYLSMARALAEERGYGLTPICASIESEIVELAPEERKAFLADLGLEESGLDRMARTGHELLNLISYFTTGPKETRAWTVCKGDKAPQAAGKIHSDFERGFIRAETVAYEDFIANNGWTGSRDAGVSRQEGKEYVMNDGDVVLFKFNV